MAIKKRPQSPRQKMINLMYVVLMAMLAMNISSEVLDGFSIVEDSLKRSAENSSKQNTAIYSDFEGQMQTNPEKVREWFEKATTVKNMSDSLYNFVQDLKVAIVKQSDGPEGTLDSIIRKDDLEAASQVMLAPGTGRGAKLRQTVDSYRTRILQYITDPAQQKIISDNLSTTIKTRNPLNKNWEEYLFEGMPVAGAITMLTKLQNDVRHAEGEVLHNLVANIGVKDIRVNKLSAFVIPNAQTLVRGEKFTAQIVMAAVDTTQQPQIFIGGRQVNLRNNTYETVTSSTGDFTLSGYITMRNAEGQAIRRDFTQKYTVVDPSATVSADLMNVLYAGYDNPMSISIPGVPLNQVSATMTGGTLVSKGPGKYICRPSAVGQDVTITVSSTKDGAAQKMGEFTFHVRKLPDPTAYIKIGTERFKGGNLAKASLMSASQLHAAIDDGLLDIEFKVTGFEAVFFDNMGNAVPMVSEGASFSARQIDAFRKLSRSKRFYISRITAVGPDGISRKLPASMEIIVK